MTEQNCVDHKSITEMDNLSKKPKKNEKQNFLDVPDIKINMNDKELNKHHKITIENIDIYFPYELYQCQEIYMQKIIQTLNKKYLNNEFKSLAALESPTGTGKTLCLLCSVLSWVCTMRKENKYFGSIIYSTRTHSQITQVIGELKKTCYRPKIGILSSREFSCINTELKRSLNPSVLDVKCSRDHKNCKFYKNIESGYNDNLGCVDIEEIINKAKAKQYCPFYVQRYKIKKGKCDLIFIPYNYIFIKEIRETLGLNLTNNILIIDEAHNVSQNCEEAKSVELIYKDLEEMKKDLKEILKEKKKEKKITNNKDDKNETQDEEEEDDNSLDSNNQFEENKNNNKSNNNIICSLREDCLVREINSIENIMNNLKEEKNKIIDKDFQKNYTEINNKDFLSIFLKSEEEIKKIQKKEKKGQITLDTLFNNTNFDGMEEYDEVNKLSQYITENNIKKHIRFINRIINAIMKDYLRKTKLSILLNILEKINDYIENKDIFDSYTFCISEEKVLVQNHLQRTIKLNLFCFNPGIGFNDIIKLNPYSIILTSGTLAPFDILEDELKIKFETTLENEHIIDKSQFKFAIIKGTKLNDKNISFNFEYSNRKDYNTIKSLGYTILDLCKSVKSGGILAFFTSFSYLNECYNIWGECNLIEQISKVKTIFFDNKKNKNLISDFKNNENKNSILLSVFRGTSSEGIDFKDDFARMVICIGVPFASKMEEKIQLKKKYLDKISEEKGGCRLDGRKWYVNDAISNVNQTLGRVIRHKNDYGVLICLDKRYEAHYKNKLFSKWMRDKCQIVNTLDNNFMESLGTFYEEQEKKFNIGSNENIKAENKDIKNLEMKDDSNGEKDLKNFGNVKTKLSKIIKYEYVEPEDYSNKKDNNIINNEGKNESEIINDLFTKYSNQNKDDSNDLNTKDFLSKKTKSIKADDEDLNPNEYNGNKISEEIKKINKSNKSEKINIINEKNMKKDCPNISENLDINEIEPEDKEIEILIKELDNNKNAKYVNEVLFCDVCLAISSDNPNLKYSVSKCKHIICNKCWANNLHVKLECPKCQKKTRPNTLTRLYNTS